MVKEDKITSYVKALDWAIENKVLVNGKLTGKKEEE